MPSASRTTGRPVAGGQVEQERPGAVGLVQGVVAGQPEAEVVLGQEDVGDPPPDVGLVVADPDQLRGREPGQRVVAGDGDQPLRSERPPDRIALGRRSAGRSTGSPVGAAGRRRRAGRRRASGRSARRRRPPSRPAPAVARTDRIAATAPSHQRTGSCSLHSGRGTLKPYSEAATPTTAPGLVDQDGLRRGRRDVDPEDVTHRAGSGRAARSASGARRPRCAGSRRSRAAPAARTPGSGRSRRPPPGRPAPRAGAHRPGSTGRGRPTSPRSAPRASRRGCPARPCRRPPGGPGRGCRSRRCGHGTGRAGPCSGGGASSRS